MRSLETKCAAMVGDSSRVGIGEFELLRRKEEIVTLLREEPRSGELTANAIRVRLRAQTSGVVLATLDLLEFLMKRAPYFYVYIGNDTFFKQLWHLTLVKNGDGFRYNFKRLLSFRGAPKSAPLGQQARARCLALIRAWAEELQRQGRTDDAALYILSSYHAQRGNTQFPAAPLSDEPYVYCVSTAQNLAGGSNFGGAAPASTSQAHSNGAGAVTRTNANSTMAPNTKASSIIGEPAFYQSPLQPGDGGYSVDEIETTIVLLENILGEALVEHIEGEELVEELSERARRMQANFHIINDESTSEEHLEKAVALSTRLEEVLRKYDDRNSEHSAASVFNTTRSFRQDARAAEVLKTSTPAPSLNSEALFSPLLELNGLPSYRAVPAAQALSGSSSSMQAQPLQYGPADRVRRKSDAGLSTGSRSQRTMTMNDADIGPATQALDRAAPKPFSASFGSAASAPTAAVKEPSEHLSVNEDLNVMEPDSAPAVWGTPLSVPATSKSLKTHSLLNAAREHMQGGWIDDDQATNVPTAVQTVNGHSGNNKSMARAYEGGAVNEYGQAVKHTGEQRNMHGGVDEEPAAAAQASRAGGSAQDEGQAQQQTIGYAAPFMPHPYGIANVPPEYYAFQPSPIIAIPPEHVAANRDEVRWHGDFGAPTDAGDVTIIGSSISDGRTPEKEPFTDIQSSHDDEGGGASMAKTGAQRKSAENGVPHEDARGHNEYRPPPPYVLPYMAAPPPPPSAQFQPHQPMYVMSSPSGAPLGYVPVDAGALRSPRSYRLWPEPHAPPEGGGRASHPPQTPQQQQSTSAGGVHSPRLTSPSKQSRAAPSGDGTPSSGLQGGAGLHSPPQAYLPEGSWPPPPPYLSQPPAGPYGYGAGCAPPPLYYAAYRPPSSGVGLGMSHPPPVYYYGGGGSAPQPLYMNSEYGQPAYAAAAQQPHTLMPVRQAAPTVQPCVHVAGVGYIPISELSSYGAAVSSQLIHAGGGVAPPSALHPYSLLHSASSSQGPPSFVRLRSDPSQAMPPTPLQSRAPGRMDIGQPGAEH